MQVLRVLDVSDVKGSGPPLALVRQLITSSFVFCNVLLFLFLFLLSFLCVRHSLRAFKLEVLRLRDAVRGALLLLKVVFDEIVVAACACCCSPC